MKQHRIKTHVHVMDAEEARSWYQPIRPLRDWYQAVLIGRVEEAARKGGCRRACLFDAEENLKWQSG
ncbi:MAG: hypothetical protein HYV27_11770 [Candidatus Hydrogenedentes bacterium]|nr:hypothetical protein [Candidatus Hydrogenedentota bacterium]